MTETTSKAWYLLPVVFGILGGIIAYIMLRSKDEGMAKNMLYTGAAMTVLVVLFNTSSPSNVADSVDVTNDAIQTTTPAQMIAPTPDPTTTLEYQDTEYADWLMSVSFDISTDLNTISSATDQGNLINMKTYYGLLNEDATKALNEIDQFNVSPEMQPAQIEFKFALQDLKQAGTYGEDATKNLDADTMRICGDYLNSANEHMAKATEYMNRASSSN